MMYPFMVLNDGTEVAISEVREDGTVKVCVEVPDKVYGLKTLICTLPGFEIIQRLHYSEKETEQIIDMLKRLEDVIMDHSKDMKEKERNIMLYTSAEAGKMLKKLEDQIKDLLNSESKSAVFHAAAGENVEELRPKYDYAATQQELDALREKVRKVKHAINLFNVSHELPGFDGLTVDQALILLPQLKAEKERLRQMATRLPRERVESMFRSSNIIDYVITNYDIEQVKAAYESASDQLNAIQLALDSVNTTEKMRIDLL